MRPSVREAFLRYTVPLEGRVQCMYLDVKGLVTTGIGNLIDTPQEAARLPWLRQTGAYATRDEIVTEWARVKHDPDAARLGHRYALRITTLRLSEDAVNELVYGKLDANDAFLARRFPAWDTWPADAQLATHSLAWACGPAFRFPRCEAALRRRDFLEAATECRIDERGNPGVVPRNAAQKVLYRNAALVEGQRDPEVLYWPRDLWAEPPTDPPPDTEPEVPSWPTVTRLPGSIANDEDEGPDAA